MGSRTITPSVYSHQRLKMHKDAVKIKLTGPLESFPLQVYEAASTLEQLDLSGTGLSELPSDFGERLPALKILFLSSCRFATFPEELNRCPGLEMVAFRDNGMTVIPEDALPPRLRWLILTGNNIEVLPKSIGECRYLQKCMLAGNRLETLPEEMQKCRKLGLLRLSRNRLQRLPDWLFDLPELAFLSFAGNPLSGHSAADSSVSLPLVAWSDVKISKTLGQGASGIISQATWLKEDRNLDAAVKLFKGALTSDGAPEDEMEAVIRAGQHGNIIDCLGRIHGHPDTESGIFKGGLVMELISPEYRVLGLSPSMQSCTRDCYPDELSLPCATGLEILKGVAAAAGHLTSRGIVHGDLYAHNILYRDQGHAFLGDFGAATVHANMDQMQVEKLERLDVLAFGHLIEDVVGLVRKSTTSERNAVIIEKLEHLRARCVSPMPNERYSLEQVSRYLEGCNV